METNKTNSAPVDEPPMDASEAPSPEAAAATSQPKTSILDRHIPWQVSASVIGLVLLLVGVIVFQLMRMSYPVSAALGPGPFPPGGPMGSPMPGFEMEPALIPTEEIRSGGPGKDGIPALTAPEIIAAGEATDIDPGARVVGVVLNGEARAYPINVLNYHECANDTVGGAPIAVTYCPLCDSAFVFHREIGGQVREFGISGMLYESNVLLYDRQEDPKQESLWSQILMKAVTGPGAAAGLELKTVDSELTQWKAWRADHPQTTVLSTDTGHTRNYAEPAYASYFANDDTMFPVKKSSGRRPDLKNKDRVVVVEAAGAVKAFPIADLRGAPGQVIEDRVGEIAMRLRLDNASGNVEVEPIAGAEGSAQADVRRSYSFWFSWDAMHPEADVYQSP